MKFNAGLGARLRTRAASIRRNRTIVANYAVQTPMEPLEGRVYLDALPAWVSASVADATWTASTHTLSVTGNATIVADPSGDHPVIEVDGGSADLTFAPSAGDQIDIDSLDLANGATATIAASFAGGTSDAPRVLNVGGAVTIDGFSVLDIVDNSVIIGSGTLSAVKSTLGSGYNGGSWTGYGIRSSAAATTLDRSVGYGLTGWAMTDILVTYTYAGDANLDYKVDIADQGLLAGAWQQSGKVWFDGDFTYEGNVNIGDQSLLTGNWQKTISASTSGNSTVAEGQPYTLNLGHTGGTPTGWTIHWGDGSSPSVIAGNPTSIAHTYADGPATRTIHASAADARGSYAATDLNVTVSNAAPTADAGPDRTGTAGSAIALSGNFSDAGVNDTHSFQWNIKNAANEVVAIGTSQNYSFTPPVSGTYTATFTVADNDGGTASDSATLTVSASLTAPYLYSNDFQGTVGSEWSKPIVATAPNGQKFLGQFGGGNNGYLRSGPAWGSGRAGRGSSVKLVSAGEEFVSVEMDETLKFGGSVTASIWVKFNGAPATQTLLDTVASANGGGFRLGVGAAGKVYFEVHDASSQLFTNQAATGGTVLVANTWYQLTGTFDAATGQISTYVNNTLDRQVTNAAASMDATLATAMTVGQRQRGQSQYVNGIVDDVQVFNRPLSATEVTQLPTGVSNGLVAFLKFDENTGTRVLDSADASGVALNLSDLPAHSELTVSFDLNIIRSWDGSATSTAAPDIWQLTADGNTLLSTTFANGNTGGQAYPGRYPADPPEIHPLQTGATDINSLGYTYEGNPWDSTYHLTYTFAHTGSSVSLRFNASDLQGIDDESWGIDNVVVSSPGPDLAVDGVDESHEETDAGYVRLNANFDEDNRDRRGFPLRDNKGDYTAGERAALGDPDLRAAHLNYDFDGPGTWMLSYPDRVTVWRVGADGVTLTQVPSDQEFEANPDGEFVNLRIEGMHVSNAPNDALITATFTPRDGEATEDSVRLTVADAEWTIDGDNDNGTAQPDWTDPEAAAARDGGNVGKILYVNAAEDADGDTIVDALDGFDADATPGTDDDQSTGTEFVPIELVASTPYDLSSARFHIVYAADDPLGVGPTGGPLRLWKKNGSQARDGRSADLGGDFVAAGDYSAAELGINPISRQVTLWVEAVGATTGLTDVNRKIELHVDPNGDGDYVLDDTVFVTASTADHTKGSISGYKWEDVNRNGIRDGVPNVAGSAPKVVYVVDVSGSTEDKFIGNNISALTSDPSDTDDINGDQKFNTILDGEIAGLLELTDQLNSSPFSQTPVVSVVLFANRARVVDLNPSQSNSRSVTLDSAGLALLRDALKAIQVKGIDLAVPGDTGIGFETYYRTGLEAAQAALRDMAPAAGDGNVVFISDGFPDDAGQYGDLARQIRGEPLAADPTRYEVNLRAFGAGREADRTALQDIDPGADVYVTSDQLVGAFGAPIPSSGGGFIENGLPYWSIFVDNVIANGIWDNGELGAITDEFGNYKISNLAPGTYTVVEGQREGWTQSFPSISHTVVVSAGTNTPDVNFGNYQAAPDLDIDSDNSGTIDHTPAEEAVEAGVTAEGKHVTIHKGDVDEDGVPDNVDLNVPGLSFVPLVLDMGQFTDAQTVRINLAYDGSDPAKVHGLDPAGTGTLRIWRKTGGDVRTVADYVDPTKYYTPAELGLDLGDPGSRQVTLWVEAVRMPAVAGHQTIVATIDQNGDGLGSTDAVNVTVMEDAAPNQAPHFTVYPSDPQHVTVNSDAPPPATLPPSVWNVGDVVLSVGHDRVRRFSIDANGDYTNQATISFSRGSEYERNEGLAFSKQGDLFVADAGGRVGHFLPTGAVAAEDLGIGYEFGVNFRPEGVATDALGNVYVASEVTKTGWGPRIPEWGLFKYDAQGHKVASFLNYKAADRISLALDQHTLYFTRDADVDTTPEDTSDDGPVRKVFKMDLNGPGVAQLFYASPDDSWIGDLRALPDGDVLVSDIHFKRVIRLNADGTPDSRVYGEGLDDFAALSLDPDGTSFWAVSSGHKDEYSAKVYRFDLATGRLIQYFDADQLFSVGPDEATELGGIAVYGEPSAAVVHVNHDYTTQFVAVDPDGDRVIYTFVGDHEGATIDPISGVFTFHPTATGEFDFKVRATDNATPSHSVDKEFSIVVTTEDPTNRAPVIETESLSDAFVGRDYQNRVIATDADGDRLTYRLVDTPNMQIDPDSGTIHWSPEPGDRGTTKQVKVQVTDARGATANQTYTITVSSGEPGNRDPHFDNSFASNFSAVVDHPFSALIRADDPDHDPLQFTFEKLPDGASVKGIFLDNVGNFVGWTVEWTPTLSQLGLHNIIARVTDMKGGVAQTTISIAVNPAGRELMFQQSTYGYQYKPVNYSDPGVLGLLTDRPDSSSDASSADQFEVWISCDGAISRGSLVQSTYDAITRRTDYKLLFDHVFTTPGQHPTSVYVRHSSGVTMRSQFVIDVEDKAAALFEPTPVDVTKAVPFTGRQLAHFIDLDPNGKATDWIAEVSWLADGAYVLADVVPSARGGFDIVSRDSVVFPELGPNIVDNVGHYSAAVRVTPSDPTVPNRASVGATADIRVHSQPVDPPANLDAVGSSPTVLDVTWDVDPAIRGYILYRTDPVTGIVKRDPESVGDVLTPGPQFVYHDGTYADGPLVPHTTYDYKVYAVDFSGNISPASTVSGTTLDNLPPPEILDPEVKSGSHVQVKWRLPDDQPTLAGWDVLRAEKEAGPFNSILPPGQMTSGLPTYEDETTEPQKEYWYKVVAIDNEGRRSLPSEWKKVTTGAAPGIPLSPSTLQAAYGGFGRVGLKWEHAPSAGLLGFDVYRDTHSDFTPSLSTLIGSSIDLRYTDDHLDLAPGGPVFYYKVVAVSDGGTSLPSNVASVDVSATIPLPGKPSGVTAESANAPYVDHNQSPQELQRDHVHVTWDDNTLLETGYEILRSYSDDGGSTWAAEAVAGSVTADATSFDDKDVVEWFSYRYRVRAVNESGDNTSDEIAEVLAGNSAITVGPATNLHVVEATTTPLQVSLVWQISSGAPYIYRSTDGGPWERLNDAPLPPGATTFVDKTVEPSTLYSYIVRVLDTSYHRISLPSNVCDWTTDPAEDSVPIGRFTSPPSTGNSFDPTPAQITAATQIRGIVDDLDANFTDWTLLLRPVNLADQSTPSDVVLRAGTSRMGSDRRNEDALLLTLDPSLYPSGAYDLVLEGRDWPQGGNIPADLRTTELAKARVLLSSDIKLGNLTLPFTDLSVNVPGGRPITVTRVYDSSTANVLGDFGYGWKLDLSDADVRTTGRPSHRSNDGANSAPVLRQGDLIYITLPGGDQRTFAFIPRPLGYDPTKAFFSVTYEPQFVAVDGSRAKLTVDTESDGGPWELRRDGDEFFAIGASFGELGYNPARSAFGSYDGSEKVSHYYLSTEDGTKYVINATSGKVLSATDPNGNITDYSSPEDPAGGDHGVHIERDSGQRIIWISDALFADEVGDAHHIEYRYSSDDQESALYHRLWKVVDHRTGAITEFVYDTDEAHPYRLTGIIDPRGVQTLTADYSDTTGELTEVSGPASPEPAKIVGGGFDGTRARQVVTDLAGNETEMIYDKRGNVAREIKYIPSSGPNEPEKWLVTVKDYRFVENNAVDAIDTGVTNYNRPSQFQEWASFEITGADTEGLRYTKQPATPPIRVTGFYLFDPDGTNPNDPNVGFPQTTSVLNINYDPDGVDAGHPERQYLTTTYGDYFNGKPGLVTDPFGRTTRTTFDSSGNVLTTIGPNGEGTEFVYSDSLLRPDLPKGLLLQTWRVYDDDNDPTTRPVRLRSQPDVANDYYAAGVLRGLLKTSTDVSGRTTAYAYDAVGRLTHTATFWDNPAAGQPDRWVVARGVYDAAGRITSNTETTYADVGTAGAFDWTPDVNGSPVIGETVYAAARTLSQTSYDVMGQVSTTTDEYGGVTTSRYDDRGQLVQSEYPDGTVTQSVYDVMGRAVLSVDRFKPGQNDPIQATRTVYDAAGRVAEAQRVSGVGVTVTQDTAIPSIYRVTGVSGAGISQTSAGSGVWELEANFTAYLSNTQTIYDEQGRVSATIGADGVRSETEYYDDGQVKRTRQVPNDGGTPTPWTTYLYHQTDDLPAGAVSYDQVTDALGHTTRAYEDEFGRTVRTTDAEGHSTQMLYGTAQQPVPGHVVTGQPITGQQTTEIDQQGYATDRFYDAAGRLTDVWLPAVINALATDDPATPEDERPQRPHWHYTYDQAGNELTQVDPLNHTTTFTYDDHSRRLSRSLPADSDGNLSNDTETWAYDARGRLDVHADFMGRATKQVYDDTAAHGGRVLREERWTGAAGGSTLKEKTVYGYDDLGPLDAVTEYASGDMVTPSRTTTYGFDPVSGQVNQIVSPEGTIAYEYYPATGKLKRTFTAYNDQRYEYDGFGRLLHVTSYVLNGVSLTSGNVTTYAYDWAGNLDTATQPNGVFTDYTYDDANRLTDLLVKKSASGNKLFEQHYELELDGQRDYVIEKRYDGASSTPSSKVKVDWTYDALNRLTAEGRITDPTPANGSDDFNSQSGTDYTDSFTFELAGNRHTKVHDAVDPGTDETVTSTYNDRDQLTVADSSINSNDETTAYDPNGNTTGVTSSAGTKKYTWDLRNRMTGYDANGDGDTADAGDASYAYDNEGNRVAKEVVNVGHTYFLNDPQNLTGYSKAIEETSIRAGAPNLSYLFGHDIVAQSDGTVVFLVKDGHGTTRLLTDLNGGHVPGQSFDFDAYLNPLNFNVSDATTSWLAPDGRTDVETGLRINGVRALDDGRFVSSDPGWHYVGDPGSPATLHLYNYTPNNPLTYIDATGRNFDLSNQLVVSGIRMVLVGMNVYGAYAHTRQALESSFQALNEVLSGHALSAVLHAANGAFHFGMAALNLFGIRSFFKSPPTGGLSVVATGDAAQLSLRWIAVSNPAAFAWITKELAPALISLFSIQLNLFGDPPARSPSGKTTGVLDDASGQFPEFPSGEEGPAKQFWGQPGFDAVTRTHAEGHAAAWMRIKNITYAVLRINNVMCESCERLLEKMLGPGRAMTVVDKNGKTTTYTGK